MKLKWLVLFLALFLLCGCQAQQTPTDSPEAPVPAIAATEPTESVGFYEPESLLETTTNGAVQVYPLGLSDARELRFLGDDLLLFSGSGCTTLTLLAGNDRYITAQTTLDCSVSASDPAVTVRDNGMTYLDAGSRELVFLDAGLNEVKRFLLPEDIAGSVGLSQDWKTLYYCTGDALRALELETGANQLLSQMQFPTQTVTALHYLDTVVECTATYSDGTSGTLFFSAQTGELLAEVQSDIQLWTEGDFYFAVHPDGAYPELITGSVHFGASVLVPETLDAAVEPALAIGAVVLTTTSDDSASLNYYDLAFGTRPYQLTLPGSTPPLCIQPDPAGDALWFLRFDTQTQRDILCRWDLGQSETGDGGYYLQSRHDLENPDLQGLRQCVQTAQQLSEKHGVEILVWRDAVACQPWDYTLTPEYQVPLIHDRLQKLDAILSQYPAGFLQEAAAETGSGVLRICLVRTIEGTPDNGALESAVGLQFWDEHANAYLAITPDSSMEQHIYHELFHIIDSRVLSSCGAYDVWSTLNPKDFRYDYDYISNLQRSDWELTTGENQYFIDLYSMSYPKEDRARIMEYAMLSGQKHRFASAPMQAKLKTLCLGIREAFHLEDETAVFRWEQYLKEPLYP